MSGLIKRSFSLAGHRTSVALEPAFWEALHTTAALRGISLTRLVAAIDAERDSPTPLASALRRQALRDAYAECDKAKTQIAEIEVGLSKFFAAQADRYNLSDDLENTRRIQARNTGYAAGLGGGWLTEMPNYESRDELVAWASGWSDGYCKRRRSLP